MTRLFADHPAYVFALAAHAAVGQVRKYTGEPYIVHPVAVATIVQTVAHSDAMLAAALLHDVVEDTAVTLDLVIETFGREIGILVESLTDPSRPSDGNREQRKRVDRAHSARACPEAQTIKIADLIDNTRSIVTHDPAFAVTYMREKRSCSTC